MRRGKILRIRFITGLVVLLAVLLISKLYYIQIVKGDEYEARAEDQYVETSQDVYSRGNIFFTSLDGKQVAAASISSGYILALLPSLITDPIATCTKLTPYLTVSTEKCTELASSSRKYIELEQYLPQESYQPIQELNLNGVKMYRNQWRFYPGNSLAARIIGFVGFTDKSDTELHGKYGLERYYDSLLMKERDVRSVNIFAEIFSDLGDMVYRKDENVHGDIVTTIEPNVARRLDSILESTQKTYDSKMTGAIIMDPKTGAIYAMNVVPTFNLNDRGSTTLSDFKNPLVEDNFEFGSTIKALTMAAGLDSGVVTKNSTYYDAGSINLDSYTIRNYDNRGRGTVPMQEILNQSLNTGASYIALKMGKEKFRNYFLNYKLGSETGIDLPNEVHGMVDNLQLPQEVYYATASFGQGIAMTPIETIRALATLGNGGYLVTPHIASKIIYDDGTEREINYPKGAQVLKPETSEEISSMLTTVVDVALKNGHVALPHHTIAAKTGTAQMADPVRGGYYKDRYLHSFFGYFPAFDPKFIVFMYTVDPKGVQYASETLTLPFMEIAKFLINYYDIPPDR